MFPDLNAKLRQYILLHFKIIKTCKMSYLFSLIGFFLKCCSIIFLYLFLVLNSTLIKDLQDKSFNERIYFGTPIGMRVKIGELPLTCDQQTTGASAEDSTRQKNEEGNDQ